MESDASYFGFEPSELVTIGILFAGIIAIMLALILFVRPFVQLAVDPNTKLNKENYILLVRSRWRKGVWMTAGIFVVAAVLSFARVIVNAFLSV